MDSREIRRRFLSFFEERGHTRVPSSSLIPNDPSLLLTTAGMVQFKPYFLGQQDPPYPRATSSQKSFRTTDIDLVGMTDRHLTFFEMLGNFSFGDYFKEGAISFAWELVTEGYGIDPGRLWATVFVEDDEAAEVWLNYLPAERIVRRDRPLDTVPLHERGKFDNFWSMGVAGPCGPCSEIFVDRGPKHGEEGGPEVDEDRYLEIWNLVFMQYERDDEFNLVGELEKKGVDTGSGLERVAVVLQDAGSAFETDVFNPLLETAQSVSGKRYGADHRDDVSLRILAEHGRATAFLMADGVVPSNEGRGYVLRRMLRRLVSHARRLGVEKEVTPEMVERTVELMGDVYPELSERKAFILQVAQSEEEHFARTLRQGLVLLESEVENVKGSGATIFPGDAAFRYHDTYGFPIELTAELAREEGLEVDMETFERLMEEQRDRARSAAAKAGPQEAFAEVARAAGRTDFLGYERLEAEAPVAGLVVEGRRVEGASEGQRVEVLLSRTPFYAESGGQVGDAGLIVTPTGTIEVKDTVFGPGELIVHRGRVGSGEVRVGQDAEARVDAARRGATARSHTGTHVLHWALRHLLGEHARQAGSLVAPGRLRFDFNHFEALSRDLLDEVEGVANLRLAEDAAVRAYETTFDFARSQGAIALFGEKYGDLVRVVEIGDYSVELCGGTHVPHTGQVALVLLTSEGSVGTGLRRVEALVGPDALDQVRVERRLLEELAELLGSGDVHQILERARRTVARIKELENELGQLKGRARGERVGDLMASAHDVAGVSLVVAEVKGEDPGGLRELALSLRDRMQTNGYGAAVLATSDGQKATLVATCTTDLVQRGVTAPALLDPAAKAVGGGSGGRPHLAFAGGGNPAALEEALATIPSRLAALLSGAQ
ncbi:MAG TPA: alanine--tRNA ligase [Actinomycetota bacterium]|nr:alanine--tRNA ligase [Actinomycetota bacterium]